MNKSDVWLGRGQRFKILAFGELLWDLLPSGPQLGGAPFNFAYRMHTLGHEVFIVSRVGRDELGKQTLQQVQALGLRTDWIQEDEQFPTGCVDVTIREDGSPEFSIRPETAYDQIELSAELLSLAQEADCICYGTLIQRSPVARDTLYALLDSAPGAIKVCDVNLRKNCYTPETVRESIRRATILKLSEEEVPAIAEILALPEKPLPRFCRELLMDTRLALVVVTLGERGAYVVTASGADHYEPGRRVSVVDTCGSGDAFTAGFVHGLLQDMGVTQACRLANVFGALVAQTSGGTSPIPWEDLFQLMQTEGERVIDPTLQER